ncbi:hypothetical protein [Silvibacterium dinghuense]|nr:hypothetical protein [Silvibacterium dinghuense]
MAALNQLAASGAIDSTAPVQAHVELQIASSPEKIWALLINAQNWPGWNP